MKDIDWSAAPEGATHYLPESEDHYACWCKSAYTMIVGVQDEWVPDEIESVRHLLVPRPAPWTGEGLPPVGAMVEIRLMGWSIRESAEKFIGVPLRVAASFGMDCGTDMIAVDGGPDLGCEVFRAEMAVPARTPEQIAAEEREKEVNRMVATAQMLDKGWARKVCESLYDAGYRKVSP